MPVAEIKVSVPESIQSFLQEVNSIGEIAKVTDTHWIVRIENDSVFDLGQEVAEFKNTVAAVGDYTMHVDDVELVDEASS